MLIVAYHAIGARNSPVTVTPERLTRDLSDLHEAGFRFASLDDCADWLAGARNLPDRSAVITFDDGYESVARLGLPVLTRLGVPFTVFVIAGRIGGDNRWPGQWPATPRMSLVDVRQLRELTAAGATIGAHSWSHPVLTDVSAGALAREVVEAGDRLQEITGADVRHYAYPYGRHGRREVVAVSRRYRTAVNATPALVAPNAPSHDLPRLDAHDLHVALRLKLFDGWTLRPYLAARRRLRRLRQRMENVA